MDFLGDLKQAINRYNNVYYKYETEYIEAIMHIIRDDIFTHSTEKPSESGLPENIVKIKVKDIRKSKGFKVNKYSTLLRCVAELGYLNPQFNLLFRGQGRDHGNTKYGSTIYPSIFYDEFKEKRKELFKNLDENLETLESNKKRISLHKENIPSRKAILSYPEFYYSLLEHYELNKTQLINLTQSLRVAATFALLKGTSGYVFIFGMPHPHGSISHFIDQDMVLVKLQNVCPPDAKRPHYQEGYLVGNFPFMKSRRSGDNLARRLIGKYQIDNLDGGFWDSNFERVHKKVLYPDIDPFLNRLNKILGK